MPSSFVFAACQAGAERALKNEVARRRRGAWRFAFSRPGFVTFRLPEAAPRDSSLDSVFARTSGVSVGRVSGGDAAALAASAWRLLGEHLGGERGGFRHLHVWQRAAALPGDEAYEPSSLAAAAVEALLGARTPASTAQLLVNAVAGPSELVIDCVLVEPDEWWVGWHRADAVERRWPGGVPQLALPPRMISRAYLKIREALLWSELPVAEGDRCVEIGSAPGGSCLALLERGCVVTGIDPAEMDAQVLAHPNFTHLRARSRDVQRGVFRDCRWLIIDAHVAPNYALDTLEGILRQPGVRPAGVVSTLKLTAPHLADELPAFAERIRALGYHDVRMRQLAFNRQEVCAVATPADSLHG
jgi:23S rRNA (cytidine2498-2'-O)-methyltransferase